MSVELSYDVPGFRSRGSLEGESLRIVLEGEGGADSIDTIGRILEAAHAEALRLHVKEVIADLTQLEFLSSSGVKHFVYWVRNVSGLAEDEVYRIRLVSNPRMIWQKRSLEALRCFNAALVTVETIPPS